MPNNVIQKDDTRGFEIDPEKEWDLTCDCCGSRCKTLLGFVHEGEVTRAAYYVRLVSDEKKDHAFIVALGLGSWGEGTTDSERVFVAVSVDTENRFSLIDPDSTPWMENKILGRKVPAKVARNTELESEAFLLAKFVLRNDVRVEKFTK